MSCTRSRNKHAVEMVELVLERARREAAPDLVVLLAVTIEIAHPDVDVAHHVAAHVGDREAALVDLDQLLVERCHHGIDDDRQRDRRLVRVARVVGHLDRGDPDQLTNLGSSDAGTVGIMHRVDQVVDQLLSLRGGELVGRDLT